MLFWPFFAQILQIWSNWNIKNDLYERFQKMKFGHKKSSPVTMKAEPWFVYITLDKFIVDIKIWFQISTLLIKCRFYLAALTPLIRNVQWVCHAPCKPKPVKYPRYSFSLKLDLFVLQWGGISYNSPSMQIQDTLLTLPRKGWQSIK